MIRNINKKIEFLSIPSLEVSLEDTSVYQDLEDTLKLHLHHCVGMAANMIGISKRAIIFVDEKEKLTVMGNPIILKKEGEYHTEEGCLSLTGTRPCTRYQKIKVEYLDRNMNKRIKTFTGFTAEIIQHEMDHLDGIII